MTPTRAQIESWDPASLTAVADAWITLGSKAEDLFSRYLSSVTTVHGAYWEGKTAEAAQDRAAADRKTAGEVVDALEALAKTAQQGFHEIDAPLQRARMAVLAAEADRFVVSDALLLTDTAAEPDTARVALMVERQRELTDAANATENADNTVRSSLAGARDGLRVTFVSAATSGGEQGKSDSDALATHPASMTPEQLQRITETGHLTPEQVTALERGETAIIPASQMEYLNQLGRSLDGKSPQEIEDLLSKLPPDAQAAVANSLQILSNENVSATVEGDPDVPTKGGLNLLPDMMRESLTRDDLVVNSFEVAGGSGLPSIALNGVADNQAIADIVSMGDDQYKSGSTLDSALLDVGQKYLDAQVAHEQNPEHKFEYFMVDGRGTQDMAVTEQIFTAVGHDKIAVDAVVNNPEIGSDFVKDVLSHNWTDDGQAASTLFGFPDGDATVENPNDPTDVATATRTGSIMSAVGEAVSTDDAWKLLSNIPEADGQSTGQLNPDLLQTVSNSMSPYVSDLAGEDPENHPGFSIGGWTDPDGFRHYTGSANVFALMNTDETAGTNFTRAAYQEMLAKQGAYALNPMGESAANNLDTAGRLAGLTDYGLMRGTQDGYDDKAAQAAEIYARKNNAYGALMSLGTLGIGNLPGGDYINAMIGAGGDPLKESVIGAQPSGPETAKLAGFDSARQAYNILNAAPELPPEFKEVYRWAFDDGELKSWDQIKEATNEKPYRLGDIDTMFSTFGSSTDFHATRMLEKYNAVAWNAP